jgi:pyridoxamine 5'-phosphate oxidase
MNLGDLRRDYTRDELDEDHVASDPVAQFATWFAAAQQAGVPEPNAMALATADLRGRPSVRIVLLKAFDERGFVFFTDYRSRKGAELQANPHAAASWFWPLLERQVRVVGRTHRIPIAESEAYYRSRPEGSRIGAWASRQSAPIPDRETLEREVTRLEHQYRDRDIPLPTHWGGIRLVPDEVEFWQGRSNRLHDRMQYTRTPEGSWLRVRLSP